MGSFDQSQPWKGGGAMRVAAKVVGITIVNDDLCGVPSVSPVEHQVTSATHRASRPISSIIASTEEVNRNILTTFQKIQSTLRRRGCVGSSTIGS
ncbi:unnamed protein product [Camellia sinensis]